MKLAFLLALLLVPMLVCYGIRKRFHGVKGFAVAVVLSTALMSGAVIVQSLGYDWYLEHQIAPLDRNGDGIWTPDEKATWTAEDKRNVGAYIGDGGRNAFAAFIFPALSLAYSLGVAALYWLFMALKRRRIKRA